MTDRERRAAADIRAAIALLGGLHRLLGDLPAVPRVDAERLLTATSTRLMKVVYFLEPERAALAGR